MKIVTADGTIARSTEIGEIWVRGYNVTVGYFEDPAATTSTIDHEGWLHTGDLGLLTATGHVKVTGRLKEMFIVGGFNAYPAEIENVMSLHPGISEVAVIGVPDARLGEVGRAFVVPKHGVDLDLSDLIAWCREHMANFKVPRTFEIVPSSPATAVERSSRARSSAPSLAIGRSY